MKLISLVLVGTLVVWLGAAWGVEAHEFGPPAALNTNAEMDADVDAFPHVATDGAGNWVTVWWSQDPNGPLGGDADILVARSMDNGTTWTDPVALNTNAETDSAWDERPRVVTDGTGNWVAVWWTNDLGGDGDILVARSMDNGTTWTDPAALNTNAEGDSGVDRGAEVTTDRMGRWVAVWESADSLGGTIDTDYDILVARSTDHGATWTAPVALNTTAASDGSVEDRSPQLATDGAGRWVAVWWSRQDFGGTIGLDADILVARSTDHGATWTAPVALNTTAANDGSVNDDRWPHVTTDTVGNWVTVWNFHPGPPWGWEWDTFAARSTDNGASWTDPVILEPEGNNDLTGSHPRVATDGAGNWVAVWDHFVDWEVRNAVMVAHSGDNGASWTEPTPLGPSYYADGYAQVATDNAGNWVAVWQSRDSLGGTIDTDDDILVALAFLAPSLPVPTLPPWGLALLSALLLAAVCATYVGVRRCEIVGSSE